MQSYLFINFYETQISSVISQHLSWLLAIAKPLRLSWQWQLIVCKSSKAN